MQDYFENYREPVKQIMKSTKIRQTQENDPVAMAVAMHDMKFLTDLLELKTFGEIDVGFRSNRNQSAYDLLRELENDKKLRSTFEYTPYEIRALKILMIENRPDLFTTQEQQATQLDIIKGKTDSME